jgi:hypothetical protein
LIIMKMNLELTILYEPNDEKPFWVTNTQHIDPTTGPSGFTVTEHATQAEAKQCVENAKQAYTKWINKQLGVVDE